MPRFVSLKPDRVNVRGGPTRDHEVAFVFIGGGYISFDRRGTFNPDVHTLLSFFHLPKA